MNDYFDPTDKTNKAILDFFVGKTWLLVNSSSLIRHSIKKTLSQLGAKTTHLLDAKNFAEALEIIETKKPNFVISHSTINDDSAILLYEAHLNVFPNRLQSGFFVSSDEISQSEVAWALDYEMDGIIAMPLNGTSMFSTFVKAVERKVNPSPYLLKLEEARAKYLESNFAEAMNLFQEASKLDKNPFESFCYMGIILLKNDQVSEAIILFEESITCNPQYFKALKKLSEIYVQEKNYKKAYDLNLLMAQKYPTSPERIPDLIRLSIINKKYEDITNYFKLFQTINNPNLKIQKCLSAALAILGKYFASVHDTEKGVEALLSAFQFSNGKYEILKSITQSFHELKKSEILLDLFEKKDLSGWAKEVQILYFQALNDASADDNKVIQCGEKLLKNNIKDISIYKGLVERSINLKRESRYIENLVLEANRTFPDTIADFEIILKKHGLA